MNTQPITIMKLYQILNSSTNDNESPTPVTGWPLRIIKAVQADRDGGTCGATRQQRIQAAADIGDCLLATASQWAAQAAMHLVNTSPSRPATYPTLADVLDAGRVLADYYFNEHNPPTKGA